jgi:hypothetical protein
MKITLQVNSREPEVYFVEDYTVRKSDGAEEFRLGDLKERM